MLSAMMDRPAKTREPQTLGIDPPRHSSEPGLLLRRRQPGPVGYHPSADQSAVPSELSSGGECPATRDDTVKLSTPPEVI